MSGVPTGSLRAYGALGFAYFASQGLYNPYGPLWFQSLGFSTLAIGSIASLQSWTRVGAPYGWCWVGDHWDHGTRRADLLRIASVLLVIASLGLLFTTSFAGVAAVVTLIFIFNSALVPLNEALVSQRLATDRGIDLGRYGRVRMWSSIGFIVAVVVFGLLLERTGIGSLPAWYVLLLVAIAIAAWKLPRERAPSSSSVAPADPGASVWPVLRRPEVAWFFASVFFTVLAHNALYVFFSLYLDALGYGKAAVGGLWAVSIAVEVAFFWSQGRWFARWSAHTWLVLAALVSALRFAAVAAFGGNGVLLVLTQLTHAVTFAAHHVGCIALVDRYFPGRSRSRGQALYTTLGYGISGLVGGVAGGAISVRWGFEAVFGAAAAMAAIGAGCGWRSGRLARAGEA